MTVHDRQATFATGRLAHPPVAPRHPLALLDPAKLSSRVVVFTPTGTDVEVLLARARLEIAGVASTEVVQRVIRHNPDSFWAIAKQDRFNLDRPCAEGFLAFLMLNKAGMERLISGTLDGSDPDLSCIVRQNEVPAGIYVWGVHARGVLAGGVPLALEKVWSRRYRDANLYARAATDDGHRFLETFGFRRGATFRDKSSPLLHMYPRGKDPIDAPSYDSYSDGAEENAVSVTVVRSFEDMNRITAIRSAVYIAEQRCPYSEEFDGNDFSATHMIGYVGSEPAGCIRIRYFADFAKLERLAVRHEFRKAHLGQHLMRASIDLCRVKGYQRIYGHAQKRYLDFHHQFGFRPLENAPEFTFSDFDYVEIVLDTSKHPQAITIGIDPYVIIRPEGRWHRPGILESSSSRPLTRPSQKVSA